MIPVTYSGGQSSELPEVNSPGPGTMKDNIMVLSGSMERYLCLYMLEHKTLSVPDTQYSL